MSFTLLLFKDELLPLLKMGLRGFKCFLCPSGVDEFPHVEQKHLEIAFQKLQNTKAKILVPFLLVYYESFSFCHSVVATINLTVSR